MFIVPTQSIEVDIAKLTDHDVELFREFILDLRRSILRSINSNLEQYEIQIFKYKTLILERNSELDDNFHELCEFIADVYFHKVEKDSIYRFIKYFIDIIYISSNLENHSDYYFDGGQSSWIHELKFANTPFYQNWVMLIFDVFSYIFGQRPTLKPSQM